MNNKRKELIKNADKLYCSNYEQTFYELKRFVQILEENDCRDDMPIVFGFSSRKSESVWLLLTKPIRTIRRLYVRFWLRFLNVSTQNKTERME